MSDTRPDRSFLLSHWLVGVIAGLGLIASIGLWYYFISSESIAITDSLKNALPWIILVGGIGLTLVIVITLFFSRLLNQRLRSLQIANENFKAESIKLLQSQESKQKLEMALLQSQKLQAVGTLAGGIAHDFNNLLYAIIGYVEMAREDLQENTVIYRNLGKVLEAAGRGQELVARILSFSRRQHMDFKPLHLQNAIENALELLRPTIPASVILKFEPLIKDCLITGNQTQLHQVIVNIINNAVDAMDGEGAITIKLEKVSNGSELLNQVPARNGSDYCKLTLSDTGHGMDKSTMERIFEPFFTTKEVGRGTGLGLSTAHSIVLEHQGTILVDSQLGVGTTFTIVLPMLTVPVVNGVQS